MKTSKIFGLFLPLHVCFVLMWMVQPGCRTIQPPTKTHQQKNTFDSDAERTLEDVIPATRFESRLDPAFNGNMDVDIDYGFDGRQEPLRPSAGFGESGTIGEPLIPIMDSSSAFGGAASSFEIHTVEKGDNLWAISRRKNVSLDAIYAANGLNKHSILSIGQQIKIPIDYGRATVSAMTADRYRPMAPDSETTTYKVRSGDTLSHIAREYDTTVGAIKTANDKVSDRILIGETLIIPVFGAGVSQGFKAIPASPVSTRSADNFTEVGNGSTTFAGAVTNTSNLEPISIEPVSNDGAGEIEIIPAEPMLEESVVLEEVDVLFDNAVEIPVIRLDNE